jgi:hypothetical protein
MEKYQEVAEITKEYLDGELQKLFIEYQNPTFVHVQLIYEDDTDFQLDYEIDIDLKKQKVLFCKHELTNPFERTNLARNKKFEQALYDYLMKHKRA